MSDKFYKGKHVVLTGGNRGIGLAMAKQLLEAGATLSVGVRRPDQAQELQALAKHHAKAIKIIQLDVTQDESVSSFAKHMLDTRVDVLINNAGVNLHNDDSAVGLPIDTLAQTLQANTYGPIRMVHALEKNLGRSDSARIGNISSVMGSVGENQSGGSVAYRMSKSALNQYSRCLALEKKDVIVLALHPGWVQTRMGGPNAQIETDESAQGVLKVIASATAKQSGQFYRYSGEPVGW